MLVERKAVKQIRNLDERASGRIAEALNELQKGFSARLDIKKLKGCSNHYRVRVGNLRILFEARHRKTIVVYAVLPRKKAYQ